MPEEHSNTTVERRRMKSRMKELLLFIPNLVWLLIALLRDDRVSRADKAILAGTIIYVISPIDIIPDFIPFIGQVDDVYLLAISIIRLLNRTDGHVVLEHWKGDVDIKALVTNIAQVAEYFLPKRVKNVLRGKIEPVQAASPYESQTPKSRAVNE
ncbi:MAG TPA: YkvA family protein [Blastocatellia bacterium]|nr:YkvA family protein [Blastocatellia bacterium]